MALKGMRTAHEQHQAAAPVGLDAVGKQAASISPAGHVGGAPAEELALRVFIA